MMIHRLILKTLNYLNQPKFWFQLFNSMALPNTLEEFNFVQPEKMKMYQEGFAFQIKNCTHILMLNAVLISAGISINPTVARK